MDFSARPVTRGLKPPRYTFVKSASALPFLLLPLEHGTRMEWIAWRGGTAGPFVLSPSHCAKRPRTKDN